MSSLPSHPDVVVIGAGASGLSAAKALKNMGYSVVVIEAESHSGGRCITDHSLFDIPFDLGGSWLHSATINPLARIAEQQGVRLHKQEWNPTWVHSHGVNLSPRQVEEYGEYIELMWEATFKAGTEKQDQSVESSLPSSQWKEIARNQIAPMLAADPDITSAADVYHFANAQGDWLVEGGLGAFVKNIHSDVQVVVNCPATKIDYSGRGVMVETPLGTIDAKYAVITVSTGVLAANQIEFIPKLPEVKLEAIHQLPTGLLNKIGLEFDPAWQGAHQGQSADYLVGNSEFCTIEFGFFNSNLAVGFVAGRFAEQLEKQGSDAATSFCLEGLKAVFGNDITKYIRRTTETAWKGNTNTHGSYSYAVPGGFNARAILAETINDRLFFAGEATMSNAQATVHGAYLSGIEAADKISTIDR